jgi:hypothetical protein
VTKVKRFPGGKRPFCFRCNLKKKDSVYFWQKIAGVTQFFCLACLPFVEEPRPSCKERVWDNGDKTDCGKPVPCPNHGGEGRFFCDTSGF